MDDIDRAIAKAWKEVAAVTPESLLAHSMTKTFFRTAFLCGAMWKGKRVLKVLLAGLLVFACGGAGATTENPATETLPYHCQVFIATARVCIAQRDPSEQAELNWSLQSTIAMWEKQQRDGVAYEALDYACEQSSGWGSDLSYCPEAP